MLVAAAETEEGVNLVVPMRERPGRVDVSVEGASALEGAYHYRDEAHAARLGASVWVSLGRHDRHAV